MSIQKRPRVKVPLEPIDWWMEGIAIIGLVLIILLPLLYFSQLPDVIPRHFDAAGNPDGYSNKSIIWFITVIGVALYTGLHYVNRIPHHFNYSKEVTERNAPQLYKGATRMMRYFKSVIACVFAYITWTMIQTSMGRQDGLGGWFMPVFLILCFGAILFYILWENSMNKKIVL